MPGAAPPFRRAGAAGHRLELFDRCGHCRRIETPDRVAGLLLDFPGSIAQAA